MSRWTHDSRRYRQALALVQATGPDCWICGHPGSDTIDHAIPASLAPDLAAEPSNWRPAHGVNGCPQCPPNPSTDKRRNGQPRRCNQQRSNRLQLPQQTRRSRAW
jgi:5-methylcytosine-specific restriction endonuclease McrA